MLQLRENRNILQLLCNKLNKEIDYVNFCVVCKLWNEVGQSLKNEMADKFKLYCYKQNVEQDQLGQHYTKLTEYYHLWNDLLHGPWKLTLLTDSDSTLKKRELIRYRYSFGKLTYMASQEEIDKMYEELGIKRPRFSN